MTDARACAARLEAIVRERDPRRKQALWGEMVDLTIISTPTPWITAASTLHRRGVISRDLYCRLLEAFVSDLDFPDAELEELWAEIEAVEDVHVPENAALLEAYWRRHKELTVAWLRFRGYDEVATLMERDEAEYERCSDRGQIELWGPDGPPRR